MSHMGGTPVLREPAHQVSPQAIGFWTVSAIIGDALLVLGALVAWLVVPGAPGWVGLLVLLLTVVAGPLFALSERAADDLHERDPYLTSVLTQEQP